MRKLTSSLIIGAIVLLMAIIPTAPTQAQSQFQPGDVIVAEQGRSRLVRVRPDGTVEVIIANLQDPRGVALEESGSILVVEQSGNRVSRVSFANNRFTRTTVRANLNVPEGIAIDNQGRILVTNFGDGRLLRLSSDGRQSETLAMGLMGPSGVAISPEGEIFFAELEGGRISAVAADGSSRRVIAEGLRSPDQMALADTGLLYVTEFGPGRLTEVDPETGATRVILSGLNGPVGVSVGPSSASLTKTASPPAGDSVYVTNNPPPMGQNGMLLELQIGEGQDVITLQRAPINNGAGCGAVPFQTPVRFQFRQLNWFRDDGTTIDLSRIIALKLIFSRLATQLLEENGGAYVNVVTALPGGGETQWSVQNLYLRYPNLVYMLLSCPYLHFGLPIDNGTRVTEIMYDLSITPDPLTAPLGPPRLLMPVRPMDYRVGGRDNGGSGSASDPFTLGPWIGLRSPFPAPRRFAYTIVPPGKLPRVEEGQNGCAPGSVARSIKYMCDAGAIQCPPLQAQDIYNSLVGTMRTVPVGGTSDANMEGGKNTYAGSTNPPLDIDSRRSYFNQNPDLMNDVMDTLDERGDVEVLIAWDGDGDGIVEPGEGGHAAMVTDVLCFGNGQCQITYIDDNQGMAGAQNNSHRITINADGTFPANPRTGLAGGRVDGFLLETPGGAKVGAARFSLFNPLSTDTASAPATRFLRSLSFGRWIGTVGFPVSMRQPAGMNPSAMGIGQNHLLPPVGLTR